MRALHKDYANCSHPSLEYRKSKVKEKTFDENMVRSIAEHLKCGNEDVIHRLSSFYGKIELAQKDPGPM